ncbi:hypothetical protein L9F63_007579 [Diploptera punctata]|uniref:Sodium-coupled monocarboxylate transporter 2 n=1 Tax=Diploptera punctata TaxID=6984 RepID=A0AAD7Z7Z3_DIPPU|nr:hypothetical protein L9F63_007579 [Diploptera punctata]
MNATAEGGVGINVLLFGWIDYAFFIMMLAISTLIGIYFGFCGKKADTPEEYLLGGKSMRTLPVAVSLVASLISGITVMGDPTEMYTYGTLYWVAILAAPIVGVLDNYLYLPVFYELQVTSVYELRFNRRVRIMASILCTIGNLLYVPIVMYTPALALSQVTGMNLHYITPLISIICIVYTMLGGIKAVVWTDFLQGVTMVLASILVIILGLIDVGGFDVVWQRSNEGGRLKLFEMNISVFDRMNFWSVVIGGVSGWLGMLSVNQGMVQRFLSLPTYASAQRALLFLVIGTLIIKCISCFTGLLIYATYYDCDPLTTKAITRVDQVLAYYVMDIAKGIPGLPGLFVAGIFSAALSTMSTCLNSLGATLFEDFVRPCFKIKLSDKLSNNIIKCIIVVIGALCVLIVFFVDKVGGILQLAMSTNGVASGATFGLFTFGMFYPRGNAKGALIGSIVSLLVMGWIVFGATNALADKTLVYPKLPTSVEGCPFNVTVPTPPPTQPTTFTIGEAFILYRISFMYYTVMGFIIMFVVGVIVSIFTEPPSAEKTQPRLFSPVVRKMLKMNVTTEDGDGNVPMLFGWLDCVLFGLMLALSTLIGVYFGLCGKKEDTPKEYLLGGKSMSTLPVAVSLVASTISGITVMGVPSEIYTYGTLYWVLCLNGPIVGIINHYIYLPVFYELQLTSVYEGGIKAVVWTDFLQGLVMVMASIAVIVLGVIHVGGFGIVWERNIQGGRIQFFESNPSVFQRMSTWSIIIGGISGWTSGLVVNQPMVQRFLSLSSYAKARQSLVFFVMGIIFIKTITCFIGMLIFATYHNCDPLKTKAITKTDQLLSYYVMDIAASVPGLPGLFVAGIFSAALSTMSSSLNSLGATLFEDFIRPFLKKKVSDSCANNIIKCVVVIMGAVCVVMVFIVDKLGSILQLAMSTSGVTSGAMFGLFSFGMFYPRGNAKGALAGSISCLLIMGWIVFGSQMAMANGSFKYKALPTTAEGCFNTNLTESISEEVTSEDIFVLFRITFLYYTVMGMFIVFVVGTVVSLITEPSDVETMNPVLFTPLVRKYVLKKISKQNSEMQEFDGITAKSDSSNSTIKV